MDEAEPIQLNLQISATDATVNELDELARQLLSELWETDVESVELARGEAVPLGAKSADPVAAGAIMMTVLPAILPKLVDFIQAWAMRGQGRTVKFKGKVAGQAVEFEGSGEDLQRLLATLKRAPSK